MNVVMCESSLEGNRKTVRLIFTFFGPTVEKEGVRANIRCGVVLKDNCELANQCGKCLKLRVQLEPLFSHHLWREICRSVSFRVNLSAWLFEQWQKKRTNPCCE